MDTPEIVDLVQREPWRVNQGRPFNALDPTWNGREPKICRGEVAWAVDGKWWFCTLCGHCSCWSQTLHYQSEHPHTAYQRNLDFFYKRRAAQGLTPDEAKQQALHVTGLVLKAVALLPPTELGRFIDEHLR
jgi:hypothetical protein